MGMSARLVLQFLGLPQVHLDDKPIATDRRKAIALLAYLSVNDIDCQRQSYSRESLSALFWPDYEQAKAFSNLRRTIWEVHQAIGEGWLIADRETVCLNSDAEIDLDVARFQGLLSESHSNNDPALRIPLLVEATKLYRNHFLTGFSLKDAYLFNEWAYAESEELRHQLADALTTLSEDYCTLGRADKAIPYARRLISLDPLNETAHRQLMEVYLQAGQHSAALKQYQTCEQLLRKELGLDPQPETRALYKKIRRGEIKPVQVEKHIEPIEPKHNLSLQLSSFIGREKEQDEVIRLLEKNRLVTLAGVGGIGKTRLSLQVGQKLLNDYSDGVWFIPLDSLSNPTLVPQTVASVFEIRERPERPVTEVLMNVLREKTTILILDNCEHLLDACTQLITALLTNCPNLKILATSREILNMKGEATYYLPSLSIPEDHTSLEKLTEYESIQLFAQRAALALSSFRMTKENAQTILDICRRVDGIPLGIELAAAQINILRTKEILKQLNESFSLLSTDSRINLPRHQTMRASLDWSWSLLTASEQIFLRQLSVFAGGWTLESAQVVCEGNALNLISALVKKSLVIVHRKTGDQTRYRFHEIVRQYMRERLLESREEENIRTRHLQYFLQLSKQAETALRGPTQVEWMLRLNDEHYNIRAALEWAERNDVEAGLYLSGRLRRFWESFDVREGARWLAGFLQAPGSKSYPLARAKALCAQVWIMFWTQEFDLAYMDAQDSMELYRAYGDKIGEIDALFALGLSDFKSPTEKIIELYKQALILSESIGDPWRQAYALAHLGGFNNISSQLEEAAALFEKIGDLESSSEMMLYLVMRNMLNGNLQSAQKWLDKVVRASHNLNNKMLEANILQHHGCIALIEGDYERARDDFHEALEIAHALGHQMLSLWTSVRLGYVALQEGNLKEAYDIFAKTVREFQKDESEIGVVFTLEGMAGLKVSVDKHERAACLISWADATRKEINDMRPPIEQADVDKIIAACLAKMGEAAFSDA
jgi:predicted ATPase/DNA-binding SARP family transcriptional activator